MNVLVVGANGQIGSIFLEKIKSNTNFAATAMIRDHNQSKKFKDLGIPTLIANLEWEVDELEKIIGGFDAIIFTAGSGGSTGSDKTLLIDLDGAVKMMEVAEKNNIHRFVMVSALGANSRKRWNDALRPYYVAKHYADVILSQTNLEYTIVRPGRLLNEKGTGKVEVSSKLERSSIPREDVADVLIEVLNNQNTIRKSFDLVSGKKTISEALQNI